MPRPEHHVFNIAYSGLVRELRSGGTLIDPISGTHHSVTKIIWDTGATNSVIAKDLAEWLGLIPTGKTVINTVGGPVVESTYIIHLRLPNNTTVTNLQVSGGVLKDDEMLLGMDVIAAGDFTVQNCGGKTHFSFAFPPFQKKYDMVATGTATNIKIRKQNLAEKKR